MDGVSGSRSELCPARVPSRAVEIDSFWPPQRAVRRFAAEYYQRHHPDAPWLSKEGIEMLSDLLRDSDTCLEYGSGTSTAWFGRRVSKILSAEHDRSWFDRTQGELGAAGLPRDAVRLLSIEPRDQPEQSPYVRLADEFADGELTFCFVDGEHRTACIRAAIPKLASGGLLVLDDAHGVLDHPTFSPHSRAGLGPLNADWAAIVEQLHDWRMVWASDGYSDAAIWIKA
jgi:predicted O-methyltransferase YrrM